MQVRGAFCIGILAGVLCVAAPAARANTIVTPTPAISGDGPYTWAYAVFLHGEATVEVGDFFTIVDFDGLVAGSQSTNPGWTASSSNLGLCPAQALFAVLCAAADDPTIPNLIWTRTGPDVLGAGGLLSLGVFSAQSIFNLPDNSAFLAQNRDNQTGTPREGAAGGTNVPVAAIPEPASVLLLGSGLAAVARARQRARHRRA